MGANRVSMRIVEGRWIGGLLAAVRDGRPVEDRFGRAQRKLWGLAFLFFCVGDLVTTHVGLSVQGVVEVGPVVGPLLRDHGVAAMVVLKGVTVGAAYGAARVLPDPQSIGVPLGLALVGVLVTGWNLVVLCLNAL